ncbi:hypothetical protein [Streptococcus hyovaginalis]|uniref:hypothetical protein n=1 Tax=Streptococcus hyovaginalis TaxID=149015 RepID=UPI002A910799|nr:hypothetical protein [Streptococcus hyovaginalis]MDY5974208.1 hypothetical protein [Streptococcus hyovaginalis]
MSSRRRMFPLVPDDEPVIGQSTAMHLYDNEDLITNINGTYYDKDYSDVTSDLSSVRNTSPFKETGEAVVSQTKEHGLTYAEQAREKAKEDLRQKKQRYVEQELRRSQPLTSLSRQTASPVMTKASQQTSPSERPVRSRTVSRQAPNAKAKTPEKHQTELSVYSQKLRQESYILVDLPKVYKQPERVADSKPKKNSYDFLKRSQIYNHQERQEKRERQIAQELNLTRFND